MPAHSVRGSEGCAEARVVQMQQEGCLYSREDVGSLVIACSLDQAQQESCMR